MILEKDKKLFYIFIQNLIDNKVIDPQYTGKVVINTFNGNITNVETNDKTKFP